MKKSLFILLLMITAALPVAGQQYKYEVGPSLGMTGYLGEANNSMLFKHPSFTIGGMFRYTHNSRWAFKANLNYANIRGVESMFSNVAGLAFVKNIEVAYTNTILYGGKSGLSSGASINTFGLGVRVFEAGVLGVYVSAISFGELEVTTFDSPEPGTNGTFAPSYMHSLE